MSRKVILTCAVVGENQYNKAHPNFPITPQQIADAAIEAEQAGAFASLRVPIVFLTIGEPPVLVREIYTKKPTYF